MERVEYIVSGGVVYLLFRCPSELSEEDTLLPKHEGVGYLS
jgi:hypothetical protein